MRRTTAARLAASSLVAAMTLATGARADDGHPPHAHGMFRLGKPIEGRVFDARLANQPVRFAIFDDRAITQGDIDLGTADVRARSSLAVASRFAQGHLKPGPISERLDQDLKKQLRALAELKPEALVFRGDQDRESRVEQAIQLIERAAPRDARGEFEGQSAVILNTQTEDYRWPDGIIPYEVSVSPAQRVLIDEAIKHWHERTDRIRLVQLNNDNRGEFQNWVRFVPAGGCFSRIGRLPYPASQEIGLDPACGTPQIIHEIGHAVGLFHEQSRNDRDGDVKIHLEHVREDMTYNFDPMGVRGMNVGDFDRDSIMLYPALSYSKDNQPTVTLVKFPDDTTFGIETPGLGGRTRTLSRGDIEGVESIYKNKAKGVAGLPPTPPRKFVATPTDR